jgi:two-component system sensor histidine kinase RegB
MYLSYDIFQLGILLFFTGGITNPFVFLILVPAVFSSQYLYFLSSIILVAFITIILIVLTFFYYDLPHPGELHFHAPDYYLYGIPISVMIGLIFLVYFGVKFGEESRIRKKAYDKIQELMAKENELLSLGGQAAAAAHSLGTPLSTILLTVKELQKEFGNNHKIRKDLDLLVSQSNKCREILKKLSLNPNIEDGFIDSNLSLNDYVNEIVRSYQEISNKEFVINLEYYKNPINTRKSVEVIYGLRNFIGNANKFSKKKIEIFLSSNKKATNITIRDDGPGFPKDLIDKHRLGEPYIRTAEQKNISKFGLGLGTFIGKTLLEKNFANINFKNSPETGGAEVVIKWENNDLKKV